MNLIVSLSDSTTGSICSFISVSTEQHTEKVWAVNPKTDGIECEYHYFPLPTAGLGFNFSSSGLHQVSHAFQRRRRVRKPTRNMGTLISKSCPRCQTLLQVMCSRSRSQKSLLYQLIPCYPFILPRWTHIEITKNSVFPKPNFVPRCWVGFFCFVLFGGLGGVGGVGT